MKTLQAIFKRFAVYVRDFFTQQFFFALLMALIVLVFNQLRTGQVPKSSPADNVWQVVLEYLSGLGVVLLLLFFWTCFVMIRESHVVQEPSLILIETQPTLHEVSNRLRWFLRVAIVLVIGTVGVLVSTKFRRPSVHLPPPPPSIISATMIDTFRWDGEEIGTLSKVPLRSPCLDKQGRIFSLNDLSSFPGGSGAKRPWLVFTPKGVTVIGRSSEVNTYDLLFDVDLVNRGETSIAKDWKLCVLENGVPHRYPAKLYSDETEAVFGKQPSLANITFPKPVEHGSGARGWLLFSIPKMLLAKDWSAIGGLECRDYLDHKTSVAFGFSAPKPVTKKEGTQ